MKTSEPADKRLTPKPHHGHQYGYVGCPRCGQVETVPTNGSTSDTPYCACGGGWHNWHRGGDEGWTKMVPVKVFLDS